MNSTNYHKAIFLDFDGVLIDTEKIYLQLMKEYSQQYGILLTDNYYITHLLGKTRTVIFESLKQEYGIVASQTEYWNGLLSYRNNYLEKNIIKIKDGFHELINYLTQKEYIIGVVSSNSHLLIDKLLVQNGLSQNMFDFVIAREDVDEMKPHPSAYIKAIKKAGVLKNDIIVVEDSEQGIEAARSANLNVIHIHDLAIVSDKMKQECLYSGQSLFDVVSFLRIWETSY